MPDVVTVAKGNQTYALFLKKEMAVDGAHFVTKPEMPFQLGVFERPAGYNVKPHQHPPQTYQVQTTSEFLYMEQGSMKVTIFDEDWAVLAEEVIGAGDAMLCLRGGHGMEMREPTRFFEVKQGPFPGDAASKIFRPAP